MTSLVPPARAGAKKENRPRHTAADVGTVAGDGAAPPRSDSIDTQLAPGAAAASADTASARSGDRWELSPLGRVGVVAMARACRLRVHLGAAATKRSTRKNLRRATRTGSRSRNTAQQQEPEHRPTGRAGTPPNSKSRNTNSDGDDDDGVCVRGRMGEWTGRQRVVGMP